MQFGSLTPLLVTLLLSYILFVFVSEQLNPFFRPKSFLPGGSRWRRGWLIGFVFFLCTMTGLLVGEYFPESRRIALAASTAVFVTFCLLFSAVRYIFNRVEHQKLSEERFFSTESLAVAEPPINAPVLYKQVQSERIVSKVAVAKRVENDQRGESNYIDVRSTEEHVLERELAAATAHIDPNITDFDQSIAEAHFQDVVPTDSLVEEFSYPEFALAAEDTISSHVDKSKSDTSISQSEPEPSQNFNDILGEISDDDARDIENEIATKTLEEIEVNSSSHLEEIQLLSTENRSLMESKEALVSEVNQLHLKVKKSEAVARKNQALKEQATQLKNKALAFAAMERKKRKMTEIQAGKAIMKLQRSVRLLENRDHA